VLRSLTVKGFKSLRDVTARLPRFTVLFGPNAAGKSNFLDAIQVLSRIAASRTLSDALSDPIRGYPIEAFSFPQDGLAGLLSQKEAEFSLSADLEAGKEHYKYRYSLDVRIHPESGALKNGNEYLSSLTKRDEPKGPSIENVDGQLRIRRKSKPANPRREPIGLNYAILSDPRLSGIEYRAIERCRTEMSGWRTYYLDPRTAMRSAKPPSDVRDIGVLGEDIAPFLFRLLAEYPKYFDAVNRTLRSLIPSVEALSVDLDKRRGTLDIQVRQGGVDFSSRIVSEGTLRVLAICALAVNPWGGSLLAFEEPENGIHPRRLELIVDLLTSLAIVQGRQVIVTTHSPLLCNAVLQRSRSEAENGEKQILLLRAHQHGNQTEITPFDTKGPLFSDQEITRSLTSGSEDGLFESLMLRGLIDE
jgi:predicted ATPase